MSGQIISESLFDGLIIIWCCRIDFHSSLRIVCSNSSAWGQCCFGDVWTMNSWHWFRIMGSKRSICLFSFYWLPWDEWFLYSDCTPKGRCFGLGISVEQAEETKYHCQLMPSEQKSRSLWTWAFGSECLKKTAFTILSSYIQQSWLFPETFMSAYG